MIVYSHRGLDLDRRENLPENSLAAFRWAAERGCGIELDLQMTADQVLVTAHDPVAGHFVDTMTSFAQVLELAREFPALHLAVHVKSANQNGIFLQQLLHALTPRPEVQARILLFDLKIEFADRLRCALPAVGLAPSVADRYDIARFQSLTGGTLYALNDVLLERQVFDWLWLDEWDRLALHEPKKTLYCEEVFAAARAKGFKLAVISPELHKAELHQDAESLKTLGRRWHDIVTLAPDAICTDYPARLFTSLKTV